MRNRSRDASAPEFCQPQRELRSDEQDGASHYKLFRRRSCKRACFRLASGKQTKRKRNADKRMGPSSAPFLFSLPPLAGEGWEGARRASCGRARLSAFHHGSCRRAFARWAQLQARLPGTWQERIVLPSSPQPGGDRLRAAKRALPAPACPSPGNAPPGPVIVPVSVMPKAARERNVSLRARAPHSLRIRGVPSAEGVRR
jgi:hypothetical protein